MRYRSPKSRGLAGRREGIAIVGRSVREHAVDRLLLAVCRRDPLGPWVADLDADAVLPAVRYHRVAPLAHLALRDSRPDLAALLREDRDRALNHHLRVTMVLAGLGELLDDIPWLAFKGPFLSELAHPVPGLRSYGDVDVLVAASDLQRAYERVYEAGWRAVDTVYTLRHPVLPGEITIGNLLRVPVDLHWALVHSRPLRERFPLPVRDVLERRAPATIGSARGWVPDDADALVHVCLHAALAGATKLLHLLDADQLARRQQDWDAVAARARAWGAAATTAVVLDRAARLLGTPVPDGLGRELGLSRAFERALAAVDSRWPAVAVRGDFSMPRRVAMGVRPGLLWTVGSMARSAVTRVGQRLRPEPEPPIVPADAATVAQYFAAVQRATDDPGWA